jgi:hypothetical protein
MRKHFDKLSIHLPLWLYTQQPARVGLETNWIDHRVLGCRVWLERPRPKMTEDEAVWHNLMVSRSVRS